MIIKKTIILTFLICFFTHFSIYSQNDLNFEHISVIDGLSQNSVLGILQDKMGFMWFATWFGLNKYDGYKFTVYKNNPADPFSLGHNIVRTIFEDKSGIIWVGTDFGGLHSFDRETERFNHYSHETENPDSLSHNNVRAICEDSSGNIWIGTYGGGLNKFNRITHKFERFLHNQAEPNSLSSDYISSLFIDINDTIWIGTDGRGLNSLDKKRKEFTRYSYPTTKINEKSSNNILSVLMDNQYQLWIGTSGGGLCRLDPVSNKVTTFRNMPDDTKSLSDNTVLALYEDNNNVLWIGTAEGGLNRFDRKTESFTHYKSNAYNPKSLSDNTVLSICQDRSGILWIGTAAGGLNKLNKNKKEFKHHLLNSHEQHSTADNVIWAIHEDTQGFLWVGTHSSGLFKINPKTGKMKNFRNDPNNPKSLSSNQVRVIHEDRKGTIWIGTYGGGLSRLNQSSNTFIHYRRKHYSQKNISSNVILTMIEDRNGSLWIGTYGGGLDKFNVQTDTFEHYRSPDGYPDPLSAKTVRTIFEDKSDALWIGTDGGLHLFNHEKGWIKTFRNDPENSLSLSNNIVMCVHESTLSDSDSTTLWIGTYGGGLNVFYRDRKIFHCYSEKDGLSSNVIYGILEDERGHLWLSTNKGLSKFNPKTKRIINYDYKDGLQSNEFNAGAYHKTGYGEMFFGGINGFNSFYPDHVRDNSFIPPIVITEFKISNTSVNVQETGPLKKHINIAREINLTFRDKHLFFSFAALDFSNTRKNQFAFRLEGRDESWIELGTIHSLNFPNLIPGSYTLRIKGTNNDGLWNEKGISLHINISPPFWKTYWFKTALILFFLSLAILAYKKRMNYVLVQKSKEAVFDYLCRKNQISEREKEIIRLILKAKKSKEIADTLFISPHTVKHHISNIYRKLGVNSRVQIIHFFNNN